MRGGKMSREAWARHAIRPQALVMLREDKTVEEVAEAFDIPVIYVKRWAIKARIPIAKRGDSKMRYIYGLLCPIDNVLKYIGACVDPDTRRWKHIDNKQPPNKDVGAWISDLKSRGLEPAFIVLCRVQSKHWRKVERQWIEDMRAKGHPLFNRHWKSELKNRPKMPRKIGPPFSQKILWGLDAKKPLGVDEVELITDEKTALGGPPSP